MPIYSAGPITTDLLRERMGGALDDDRVAAFILDQDLDALVAENRSNLTRAALAEARQRARAGIAPDIGTPTARSTSTAPGSTVPDSTVPGNGGPFEEPVPAGKFPFVLDAHYTDADGNPVSLSWDDSPRAAAFHPGGRYRYGFETGKALAVITGDDAPDPARLRLVWADMDEALAAFSDVAAGNAQTVAAAQQMLAARIVEFARTEQEGV